MISFKAIVTADFHLTTQKNISNAIIPMMSWCDEILQCIVQQAIRLHPDAFILLGDNTNAGNDINRRRLARRLQTLVQHGIPIVMIPGNHDFNHCDIASYRDTYAPLFPSSDQDTVSLSHAVSFHQIRLLAMDDSSFPKSTQGKFHPGTMYWLQKQLALSKENGQLPIFLSHHNVLLDAWTPYPGHYQIQNKELPRLLIKYGASIILSAHQHFPSIRESEGLFEIIVPMPFMAPQILGFLEITGNTLSYSTMPIALSNDLKAIAVKNNNAASSSRLSMFEGIFTRNQCPNDLLPFLLRLLKSFYTMYERGLGEKEKEIIRNDPYYPLMMQFLGDSMYKGWIDYLVNRSLDTERLQLIHNGQAPWRFHHDPHRL